MDNAQKAIMLGVGLFITIIVIAAVMAITGIGQDLVNQGQSQLTGISSQLLAQIRSDYDNRILSGSQVKTAVNKYYQDETLGLYIYDSVPTSLDDTNRASSLSITGQLTVNEGNAIVKNASVVVGKPAKSAPEITSGIVSTYRYKSRLIADETTGTVIGILITKQ